MQIFLTILVLILMLGILVSSHEAGHLVMAKCFNVYCLEYSIGFGPKLFSHKKKGHETTFSIRAVPLGGYVSMFGEGVELPDGVVIPESRSVEGVAKWKRALILSAGISVNLMLAVVFTFIYTVFFPSPTAFDTGIVDDTSQVVQGYSFWADGAMDDYSFNSDTDRIYAPLAYSSTMYVVDSRALIDGQEYVAIMKVTDVSKKNLLTDLTFYKPISSYFPTASRSAMGLYNFPDTTQPFTITEAGSALTLHLAVMQVANRNVTKPSADAFAAREEHVLSATSVLKNGTLGWSRDSTFYLDPSPFFPTFGDRMLAGCKDFAYFFAMIGLGLKSIFSFDFSQVGSIVAMGSMISTASSAIGWGRTFFFFGGYLSLNLAIFNLLPFPGLDGWSLLVTLIEAIRKKKVPEKVKNGFSIVGLALLFIFAIAITVKDIIAVIGG
jgi:membrane-associated protease RseP (regulator of RpoE activity)